MAASGVFRIGNAGGFWGDREDALADQVGSGPIDAIMADYLAEVTMSILRRQMSRDPEAGWARDFVVALEPALAAIVERKIQIVTNAGGMNPRACARAVAACARRLGHAGVKIGVVLGDDIEPQLDALLASGSPLSHLDTGEPLAPVRSKVLSANAYLGADPIAEALRAGAQIVVTGRTTDSALALGPLLARFGWANDDWDRRSAGIVAGHLLECGAQVTGGNSAAWSDVPDMARIGYPIAEVSEDGSFVLTKHDALGGVVDLRTVKEQLLYEIGDPTAYMTPDAIADFTSLHLEAVGANRVRVAGVRGRPAPETLKASITVAGGYRTSGTVTFVGPDAISRARSAESILLARCRHRGIEIEAHNTDILGVSGAHGPMAPAQSGEPTEVLLRVAIRTRDKKNGELFAKELAPLFLCGPPGMAQGPDFTGRPEPQPIVDFWPALVARSVVRPTVEIIES